MHCAFAKYEQGFKRKNEYLERRRVKRKEEIDRGVNQELKKRGMAGELDDPLLTGIDQMDSNLQGHGLENDDDPRRKPFEDSELSNGIVGIDTSKKPRHQNPEKITGKSKKDKSSKKKKSKSSKPSRKDSDDSGSDDGFANSRYHEESSLKITT
jgi:hypothetical protein